MKKGTKVRWMLQNGHTGEGITVSDADETNHVLVAVLMRDGEANEVHHVLWCKTSWLKEIR